MIAAKDKIRAFFLPKADKRFFIRLSCVIAGAILFFGFICRPYVIHGTSMYPTYRDGQFILGFKQKYRIRDLKRGDIVMVKLAGDRVMYLKRVVGFPGEKVEFRKGELYIDGELLNEPYVNGPSDWELPVREVDHGFVYVVGDNRAMPIDAHLFGSVLRKKINGGPLW